VRDLMAQVMTMLEKCSDVTAEGRLSDEHFW
jgi:hypothetical protein